MQIYTVTISFYIFHKNDELPYLAQSSHTKLQAGNKVIFYDTKLNSI